MRFSFGLINSKNRLVRVEYRKSINDTIKKEKFNLTATIGAGTLVNQGQMENGIWFWKFQYPVRMRLVGQTSTRPEQAFTFEITVRRVDPRIKPGGMEISQMVSRNAASGTVCGQQR